MGRIAGNVKINMVIFNEIPLHGRTAGKEPAADGVGADENDDLGAGVAS
jgi:hypothetical protein